jgi:hypothetical protein
MSTGCEGHNVNAVVVARGGGIDDDSVTVTLSLAR